MLILKSEQTMTMIRTYFIISKKIELFTFLIFRKILETKNELIFFLQKINNFDNQRQLLARNSI